MYSRRSIRPWKGRVDSRVAVCCGEGFQSPPGKSINQHARTCSGVFFRLVKLGRKLLLPDGMAAAGLLVGLPS